MRYPAGWSSMASVVCGAMVASAIAGTTSASARMTPVPHTFATVDNCAYSTALVGIGASGPSPTSVRAQAYGIGVTFANETGATITVADSTGTALFSHAIASGGQWTGTYPASGDYTFDVVGNPSDKGTVSVPFCNWQAKTVNAGQSADLNWAYKAVSGFDLDVEILRPGAAHWTWWKYGTTAGWAAFSSTKAGYYGFRSRLRRVSTGKASGFSPESVVHVR
jgi:hypothetical protein